MRPGLTGDFVLRGETQGRCRRTAAHARLLISGALSLSGSLGSASVAVAPALPPPPTAVGPLPPSPRRFLASSRYIFRDAAPGRPSRPHDPVLGPQWFHGPLRCPPLGASATVSAAAAASPVPGRRRGTSGGRPGLSRHAAAATTAALGHGSRRDSGRSSADPAAAPFGHSLGQDGTGEQVPARTHGREGLSGPVFHSRHAVADGR